MVQFSVCYIFILRSTVIINIDCQLIMNFTLIRTISLSLQRSLLGEGNIPCEIYRRSKSCGQLYRTLNGYYALRRRSGSLCRILIRDNFIFPSFLLTDNVPSVKLSANWNANEPRDLPRALIPNNLLSTLSSFRQSSLWLAHERVSPASPGFFSSRCDKGTCKYGDVHPRESSRGRNG